MTTTTGNIHLTPHDVAVDDAEFGTTQFYCGQLVWSPDFDRDIGELWKDDTGMCWREVNDRKRSDLLTYGHATDEYDAIRAVVRQAEVTTR